MIPLINEVQEYVRRFNQEEAIWQCYEEKRKRRRRLFRMRSKLGEKLLDQLDWITAEREMRRSDCVGKQLL